MNVDRRQLLRGLAAGALGGLPLPSFAHSAAPKVVIVRFGGGVRRRETILPETTFAPFLQRQLIPRGLLYRDMVIEQLDGVETSHAQGTLYLLTGRYDAYHDVEDRWFGDRFEPTIPTLFEAARKQLGLAEHEVLVVNNENRVQDEFLTFSSHPDHGVAYRAGSLSRWRYRHHRLAAQVARGDASRAQHRDLEKLQSQDYRLDDATRRQGTELRAFWDQWLAYWGDSGLVEPRGDRGQTELALWALQTLRPRLMMINYSDCDYVHWGLAHHYHRGISVMDEGLRATTAHLDRDPYYRDDTLLIVVPDCGRDDNRFLPVPFQHHFGDRSAHEIFALFVGPGVTPGVVDRRVQQADIAPTVASVLGLALPDAEGSALTEVWS